MNILGALIEQYKKIHRKIGKNVNQKKQICSYQLLYENKKDQHSVTKEM